MVAIIRDTAQEQWIGRVLGIVIGAARARRSGVRPELAEPNPPGGRPAHAYAAPDDLAEAVRPAHAYAMPEDVVEDGGRPAHAYAAPDDLAAAVRPAHAYSMPEDPVEEGGRPAHAYAAPDDLATAPRRASPYSMPENPIAERAPPAPAHPAPSGRAAPAQPADPYAVPDNLVAQAAAPPGAPADAILVGESGGRPAPAAPPQPGVQPGYVRPPAAPPPPPVAPVRQPAPMSRFDPSRAAFGDSIKAGGFGSVSWLNTDQPGAPPLVIKVPNTEQTRAELEHEATYYAKAGEHPNLARCYGMQEVEGKRGLVLEGIQGRDMAGTLSTLEKLRTGDSDTVKSFGLDKQLSQESFVGTLQYMLGQTLSGLAHLEAQGVIHNDIRPDNIMCDQTTGEVKIVDFGLAKNVGDTTRGKAPIGHGMVSPEFGTRAPLTGKHDVFGAGEVARKAMERDQFRYGTDKEQKDLNFNDARAFAQPDAEGKAKRALNPKQEPELLDARVAKLEARAQALLADPGFQASEAGQALAGAAPRAKAQLEAAQTLAEAEDAVRELDWQVSQAELTFAKENAPAPAFIERWNAVCQRLTDLVSDPFVKGTPAVADLQQQRQALMQIYRQANTLEPAQLDAALDDAEARLRYDEGRLRKAGQTGAASDYTRFVNWAMNPDPAQRPTAAQALQHPFLTDRLLDDASAQEILKKVLGQAKPAAGGSDSDSSSASSSGSDSSSWSTTGSASASGGKSTSGNASASGGKSSSGSASGSLSTSGSGTAIQPDTPTDARSPDSGRFQPGSGSAAQSDARSV